MTEQLNNTRIDTLRREEFPNHRLTLCLFLLLQFVYLQPSLGQISSIIAMATETLQEDKATPEYILRRNYAASARLNLQHYQHTQVLTYLLHPTIKKALPSTATIGDIATGTGVWLLDLSSELEGKGQYEFEGWDISDAQFPRTDSLPKNIKFGTFDCSTPEGVPEDLVGKYDIIHVGLLALVVKGGDPGTWIENLMRMLS
jgi:hypothetical protein